MLERPLPPDAIWEFLKLLLVKADFEETFASTPAFPPKRPSSLNWLWEIELFAV